MRKNCHKFIVACLALIMNSPPCHAVWEPSDESYVRSKKPFTEGNFQYTPELNPKKPHNPIGFKITAANRTVLQQRFKVLSVEEYKCLILPHANARLSICQEDSNDPRFVVRARIDKATPPQYLSPIHSFKQGEAPLVVVKTCSGGMNPDFGYEVFRLERRATHGVGFRRGFHRFSEEDFTKGT